MKIKKLGKKDVIKILILVIPVVLIGLFLGQAAIIFLFILSAIILDFAIFLFPPIKYFGIELITSTVILIGFVYGPSAGAVAGLVLLILHLIIARYSIGPYIIWLVPQYVGIGFLSGVFVKVGLMNLGIYLTIGTQLINLFLSFFFDPKNFSESLIYSISNSAFNIFLFMQLSGFIMGVV